MPRHTRSANAQDKRPMVNPTTLTQSRARRSPSASFCSSGQQTIRDPRVYRDRLGSQMSLTSRKTPTTLYLLPCRLQVRHRNNLLPLLLLPHHLLARGSQPHDLRPPLLVFISPLDPLLSPHMYHSRKCLLISLLTLLLRLHDRLV